MYRYQPCKGEAVVGQSVGLESVAVGLLLTVKENEVLSSDPSTQFGVPILFVCVIGKSHFCLTCYQHNNKAIPAF